MKYRFYSLHLMIFLSKGRFGLSEVLRIDENYGDLAERCRIALEKSYGMKIPIPKSIVKRKVIKKW
jgi:hypothetical protein